MRSLYMTAMRFAFHDRKTSETACQARHTHPARIGLTRAGHWWHCRACGGVWVVPVAKTPMAHENEPASHFAGGRQGASR